MSHNHVLACLLLQKVFWLSTHPWRGGGSHAANFATWSHRWTFFRVPAPITTTFVNRDTQNQVLLLLIAQPSEKASKNTNFDIFRKSSSSFIFCVILLDEFVRYSFGLGFFFSVTLCNKYCLYITSKRTIVYSILMLCISGENMFWTCIIVSTIN